MIFSDTAYLEYKEEMHKIASLASAYRGFKTGATDLYNKAKYSEIAQGMGQSTGGLGGLIGGGLKGAGNSMAPTSKVGKGLKRYGNIAGDVLAEAAYKKGGIVKKPTVARLAEDGDPEAVIPLGNDRADKRNRKRVIRQAMRVIKRERRQKKR